VPEAEECAIIVHGIGRAFAHVPLEVLSGRIAEAVRCLGFHLREALVAARPYSTVGKPPPLSQQIEILIRSVAKTKEFVAAFGDHRLRRLLPRCTQLIQSQRMISGECFAWIRKRSIDQEKFETYRASHP
jgi:hypothetical protein